MISIPCLLYLFMENRKRITFYTLCGAGMYLGAMIHIFSYFFYVTHPNYNFHVMPLAYSIEALASGMTELDLFLNNVTPLFWKQGFILLPSFLAVGIIALKKTTFCIWYFPTQYPIARYCITRHPQGSRWHIFYLFSLCPHVFIYASTDRCDSHLSSQNRNIVITPVHFTSNHIIVLQNNETS